MGVHSRLLTAFVSFVSFVVLVSALPTVQICARRKEFPRVETELNPVQGDTDAGGPKN
jgi:hypothetical protein